MTNLTLPKLQILLAKIPHGMVTTYAELAKAMGASKAARTVGTLCGKNTELDKYPCCKVVKSDGQVGSFARGTTDKIRRLAQEGIQVKNGKVQEFSQKIYRF